MESAVQFQRSFDAESSKVEQSATYLWIWIPWNRWNSNYALLPPANQAITSRPVKLGLGSKNFGEGMTI